MDYKKAPSIQEHPGFFSTGRSVVLGRTMRARKIRRLFMHPRYVVLCCKLQLVTANAWILY